MTIQYIWHTSSHRKYYARRRNAGHPFNIATTILDDRKNKDNCSKQMKQCNEEIILNVGGTKFRTFKSKFSCHPDTRLAKLVHAENDQTCLSYCDDIIYSSPNEKKEYFFHRSPQIFNYILDIYREGTLHSPLGVCTIQLNQELKYWGIDDELFGPCCALSYHQNMKNNKAEKKRFITLRKARVRYRS